MKSGEGRNSHGRPAQGRDCHLHPGKARRYRGATELTTLPRGCGLSQ